MCMTASNTEPTVLQNCLLSRDGMLFRPEIEGMGSALEESLVVEGLESQEKNPEHSPVLVLALDQTIRAD